MLRCWDGGQDWDWAGLMVVVVVGGVVELIVMGESSTRYDMAMGVVLMERVVQS